jgi:quinol monooxygenase YgiN
MSDLDRRAILQVAAAATVLAGSASLAQAQVVDPPLIAAPAGAQPVTVTIRLTAKDADALRAHLLNVIPVTRTASGCRYSNTFQDPNTPTAFLLVQGWDSAEQQQGYIAWRDATGDLAQLIDMLSVSPVVETFALIDA